jgi:uncharacterized protein
MMKFAVNYSCNLIRLLDKDLIELDLIKCPDWEGMVEEAGKYKPVTIHFDLKTGLGACLNANLERLEAYLHKTPTPHVNTHLIAPRNFNPNNAQETRKLNQLWRDEINRLTQYFGNEHVVLEHFPYTPDNPQLHLAADPSTFSNVIKDTHCQFLLDLAHARITANTLDMDVKGYISRLPVERLRELHITGIKMFGGIMTDHFRMQKEDWDLLRWALDKIKKGYWPEPYVAAFEYGGVGDIFAWRSQYEVLENQVPILYEMIHSI